MTNRLGRAIDRARLIGAARDEAAPSARPALEAQLRILWGRARLIRSAIALASISALMAAALVIALFFSALLRVEAPWLIMSLFVACMASLIASLVFFLHDINQSLAALKLEIGSRGIDL
jgi:anti-sigma-K factor RskA